MKLTIEIDCDNAVLSKTPRQITREILRIITPKIRECMCGVGNWETDLHDSNNDRVGTLKLTN